jgi:hypothetical protein
MRNAMTYGNKNSEARRGRRDRRVKKEIKFSSEVGEGEINGTNYFI